MKLPPEVGDMATRRAIKEAEAQGAFGARPGQVIGIPKEQADKVLIVANRMGTDPTTALGQIIESFIALGTHLGNALACAQALAGFPVGPPSGGAKAEVPAKDEAGLSPEEFREAKKREAGLA